MTTSPSNRDPGRRRRSSLPPRPTPAARPGFTLVELMIVVVILGILAAIAIPVYMKFVGQSKVGEAKYNLATIVRHTEEFWNESTERGSSAAVVPGALGVMVARYPQAGNCGTVGTTGFLANGQQVPRNSSDIQQRKYLPTETTWACSSPGPGCATDTAWHDLHYAITMPIQYGYCFEGTGTGSASTFTVFAYGDVDGDGTWSQFARSGAIRDGKPTVGPYAVFAESE